MCLQTVERVYGGDWDLYRADRKIKSAARWEKQKVLLETSPEVLEAYRAEIRARNRKRKEQLAAMSSEKKEEIRQKRNARARDWYVRNFRKSEPTDEQLLQKAKERREKAREAYRQRTPEQRAQYAAAAKAKRDAMTPEQKEAAKLKKAEWYQRNKMQSEIEK